MAREQRGSVFAASNAWHIKYWNTELVDGQPKRVQRSERLCDFNKSQITSTVKDPQEQEQRRKLVDKGYVSYQGKYVKVPAQVEVEAAKIRQRVNAQHGAIQKQDVTIADFWEQTFLPWCEKLNGDGVPNVKPSTLNGWQKLWRLYLAPRLMGATFKEYDSLQASGLLDQLVDAGLGTRTVGHVKSLGHRLFKSAVKLKLAPANPWSDAEPDTKPKAPKKTHAYSLEEGQAILTVLNGKPEAQLMFALAFCAGLRPGEITGLQWGDVEGNWLRLRRSVWRGHIVTPKTVTADSTDVEKNAPVPMIAFLKQLIENWRVLCGNPSPTQWMFETKAGDPKSAENVAYKIIKPICEKEGLYWDGLYSARRGASSILTELTGNALAASYLLRHKTVKTTETFYTKLGASVATEGMQALENKVAGLKLALPALPEPARESASPKVAMEVTVAKDGQQ